MSSLSRPSGRTSPSVQSLTSASRARVSSLMSSVTMVNNLLSSRSRSAQDQRIVQRVEIDRRQQRRSPEDVLGGMIGDDPVHSHQLNPLAGGIAQQVVGLPDDR